MKILENILEVLISPFTFIFRHSSKPNEGFRKSNFFVVGLISVVLTVLIILYVYRDFIFK